MGCTGSKQFATVKANVADVQAHPSTLLTKPSPDVKLAESQGVNAHEEVPCEQAVATDASRITSALEETDKRQDATEELDRNKDVKVNWDEAKSVPKVSRPMEVSGGFFGIFALCCQGSVSSSSEDVVQVAGSADREISIVHSNEKQEPMWNFEDLQAFNAAMNAASLDPPAWMPNVETKAIGITVKIKVKHENRRAFVEAMNRSAEATLRNESAEAPLYRLNQSPFDKNIFFQVEEWSSVKALAHHTRTEDYKKFISVAGPLMIESHVCFYELDVDDESASRVVHPDHHLPESFEPMRNFKDLQALETSITAAAVKPPAWMPYVETNAIGLTWKYTVKPEHRTAFVKIMKRLAQATLEKEKGGALQYKLHQSPCDQDVFFETKEWSSVKALAHHFTTEHFKQADLETRPFLLESCGCLYELGVQIEC